MIGIPADVTITRGDPAPDGDRPVERHERTEVRATVEPTPYIQDGRYAPSVPDER